MKRRGPTVFRPAQRSKQGLGKKLELRIEGLSDDGRGVAHNAGQPIFVRGALPGENVAARLTARHRRHQEASLERVLEASEKRIPAPCEYVGQCGGCQLQHLSQADQQQHKLARLKAIVSQQGFSGEVGLLPSPAFAYRHRARLAIAGGQLGFRGESSHKIVGISECLLLAAPLNRALAAFRQHGLPVLANLDAELVLSCGVPVEEDATVAMQLVFNRTPPKRDWQSLAAGFTAPNILHSVLAPGFEWLNPEAERELKYQLTDSYALRFSPGDFTQVNPAVNRAMITQLLAWLAPEQGEAIIDYFCGLGNFSIPLASAGARVRGYDAGVAMVERAQAFAEESQLDIRYLSTDLFDSEKLPAIRGVEKAVLDPPRAGARALCEQLAGNTGIRRLVYISCDPATLERDLKILLEGGFAISEAAMPEMFPQSYHMESMVLLSR